MKKLTESELNVIHQALQAYSNHLEPSKQVPAIRDWLEKVNEVREKVFDLLFTDEDDDGCDDWYGDCPTAEDDWLDGPTRMDIPRHL